uniref:Uncharacterized protein n=1 Tax=Arundo donax TaxID=35708 RepID=A0A0A9F5R4_ARUDO
MVMLARCAKFKMQMTSDMFSIYTHAAYALFKLSDVSFICMFATSII